MNIIVEGLDNSGKGSLIKNIQDFFYFRNPITVKPVQVLYYSNFKTPTEYSREISKIHYKNGFELIKHSVHHQAHTIFDRFHLGEYVYSPMYRKYNGDYVFDLELKNQKFLKGTILIVLIDTAENLIARDDGLSHSTNLAKKRLEIQSFATAYDLSIIPNKILINVNGKSIKDVYDIALKLIKKIELDEL